MTKIKLHLMDINDFTAEYDGEPFDAVLTDAPYELAFMNRSWDKSGVSFNPDTWAGILKHLRSGASLLCFGGTRTYHRIAVAIEDAGFEIRDSIGFAWVYGTGFPKSHNISKAIDKSGAAATHTWEGYGTALKPAWEPIVLAMAPLDGTFANNALTHGVVGLNIDASRIEATQRPLLEIDPKETENNAYAGRMNGSLSGGSKAVGFTDNGRWPANLILDEEAAALLDDQSGQLTSGTGAVKKDSANGYEPSAYGRENRPVGTPNIEYGDTGGASRFFYQAKVSKKERNAGLTQPNKHPTLKPIELTKYLATMLLPPNTGRPRRILVPFCGSGSEVIGALLAGWDEVIGVDISDINVASERVHWWHDMSQKLQSNDVQTILNQVKKKPKKNLLLDDELPILRKIKDAQE